MVRVFDLSLCPIDYGIIPVIFFGLLENFEKWIRNIFEIMNGHLERKRFISCFIESGKVFINQNAGKFLISEEYDQEGYT